jgi:hypothetical protein
MTTSIWRATARKPLTVRQLTSTGHEPGGTVASTVHDQETKPPPSASFAVSPSAVLNTEAYITLIEQAACGSVVTEARAVCPRETGVVSASVMSSDPMTLSITMGGGAVVGAGLVVAGGGDALRALCVVGGAVTDPDVVGAHPCSTTASATIAARMNDTVTY